jgi:hypothetical protein
MDLRIKEVMCNLRNYNFDELGPYKMDELEARKLLDGLFDMAVQHEQDAKRANDEQEIRLLQDINDKLDNLDSQNDKEAAEAGQVPQMSDDEQFMSNIICEICDYAVQNGMNPNETLAAIAQNIQDILTVSTFENWGKDVEK